MQRNQYVSDKRMIDLKLIIKTNRTYSHERSLI